MPLDSISDVHLHRLLDNVFQAMVLLIGLEDLVAQRNTERIKKDLRVSKFLAFNVMLISMTMFTCTIQIES